MYLKTQITLVRECAKDKFNHFLCNAYGNLQEVSEKESRDNSMTDKGITVIYRDTQYKKKIKLVITINNEQIAHDKFIRKLNKRIDDYFDMELRINDFTLSDVTFVADVDVMSNNNVSEYLHILARLGKVKGFSPCQEYWRNKDVGFWLEGNSNGIEFLVYDYQRYLKENTRKPKLKTKKKKYKEMVANAEGLLRIEVHLTEPKTIRKYSGEGTSFEQLSSVLSQCYEIFVNICLGIIPTGDHYKKSEAIKVIWGKVDDKRMRRKMLRLLELIPEKKSLLFAQKELNSRRLAEIMNNFADIGLSPVTLGKRQAISKLESIYSQM